MRPASPDVVKERRHHREPPPDDSQPQEGPRSQGPTRAESLAPEPVCHPKPPDTRAPTSDADSTDHSSTTTPAYSLHRPVKHRNYSDFRHSGAHPHRPRDDPRHRLRPHRHPVAEGRVPDIAHDIE